MPGHDTDAEPILPVVECDWPGVRTVVVPQHHEHPDDGQRLRLRYRVFAGPSPGAPTVIVVPGGPGTPLMDGAPTDAFALGAVPTAHARVVYVDARGSGCNTFPELAGPGAAFTVEAVARDLLAVAEAEALDHVTLYGASFGTAAATVAASLAEQRGHPHIDHMVLEGTLGQAFPSFESYLRPLQAEWERVEPTLDSAWREAFAAEPWDEQLYWTRAQWGAFVSAQLILGDLPGEGPLLRYWLRGLSAEDPSAQAYVGGFMAAASGELTPGTTFRQIACRELWDTWQMGRELRDGRLRAFGDDVCVDLPHLPFDVADFPTTGPVTYLHGSHDPTTTAAQLAHHAATRPRATRRTYEVPDASHAPLTLGFAGRDCAESFWLSILEGSPTPEEVIAECNAGGAPEVWVHDEG